MPYFSGIVCYQTVYEMVGNYEMVLIASWLNYQKQSSIKKEEILPYYNNYTDEQIFFAD